MPAHTSLEKYLSRLLPAVALLPALVAAATARAWPGLSWLYLGAITAGSALATWWLGRRLGRHLDDRLSGGEGRRAVADRGPSEGGRTGEPPDTRDTANARAQQQRRALESGHEHAERCVQAALAIREIVQSSLRIQRRSRSLGGQLADRELPADALATVRDTAQFLAQEAERAHRAVTHLTSQVRCLHAGDTGAVTDVDTAVARALDQLQPRLQRQAITAAVTSVNVAGERVLACVGDEQAVQAVFVQILENALDALASAPQGDQPGQPGPPLSIDISLTPGATAVSIAICDRGVGLPAGSNAHLLEPGVSTKGAGRGAGLAVAQHQLTRIGGCIAIERRSDGPGACVQIAIPVA